MENNKYIGIDIGGTFTDVFVLSAQGIKTYKIISDNKNPEHAIIEVLKKLELTKDEIAQIFHSTTLVTNMLLEHKGVKTGFITSKGMLDILHIGRHMRPLNYSIAQTIPWQDTPPIPRNFCYAINERIDKDGNIIVPLIEAKVKEVIKELIAKKVKSIAVGFLHSYSFPNNEEQVAKWIKEVAPDISVSLSSQVSPRFREYERFMSTALDARIKPIITGYLNNLAMKVGENYKKTKLWAMLSDGGLSSINDDKNSKIYEAPINLALSGLAAAGNGFVKVAKDLKLNHCVGLDVGGTSADITVIKNGKLNEAPLEQRQVANFPLQIPMLDLQTIGAGGGSLIYRDEFGQLHVGPESAGADPGPACYDQGGKSPTITDAAIVVGRIPKNIKLGDEITIKAKLSREAFISQFNIEDDDKIKKLAHEALSLAEANIAFAIREQTVARGIDPHELSLIIAGGAGGLLACGIAEILEIKNIIIPPALGVLAAWGLLSAPIVKDATLSILKNITSLDNKQIKQYFTEVTKDLKNDLGLLHYKTTLRYIGQGFEVSLGFAKVPNKEELLASFNKAHNEEYGFTLEDCAIEWVELRGLISQEPQQWNFSANRLGLQKGDILVGPQVITEKTATTYLKNGWQLTVLVHGYLQLERCNEK